MRKRFLALLLPAALAAALLSGCAKAEAVPYVDNGAWEGDVFTHPFLSLAFTLPEGWTASDREALAAMDAEAEEALAIQSGLDTATETGESREPVFHYALLAKESGEGDAAGVTVLAQRSEITAKDYLRALKNGAKTEGVGYTLGDSYKQMLGGMEYTVIPVNVQGNATTQRQYVRDADGYLINIMVFADSDEEFISIEAAFGPVV